MTATPAPDVAVGEPPQIPGQSVPRRRRSLSWLGTLPMTAYVVLFGLVPFGTLVLYSFYQDGFYTIVHTLTLKNYRDLFTSDDGRVFFAALWRTLLIALAVTAIAVPLAYAVAFHCIRNLRRTRALVFLLIVSPLFLSYLVKVYAWRGVLGERGLINYVLQKAHLIDEPLGFLLFNRVSVSIALLSAIVPFTFIPLYAAIERVPGSLLSAAADLGASPWMVFTRVLLPLTRRGVIAACTLSFILCLGDFIASQLLGGASGILVGRIIYSYFGLADDWPSGTARAVVVLIVAGLVIAVFTRLARGSVDAVDVELDQLAR